MKKVLYISGSIAVLLVAMAVCYYLIVIAPQISNAKLEQARAAQEQSNAIEKEKLKQQCLALKYSNETVVGGSYTTHAQAYAKSQLSCN